MKTNIFKYIFFISVIVLIGLAVYLLYKDKKEEIVNAKNNKLEINMINEFNIGITGYDTMNPILSKNRDIQYIDKLIFDSLVDITEDFKINNLLAKEVSKINPNSYVIKLKEDIYWHDGTKFTAKDVLFTVENLMNNTNSIYSENVKYIEQIDKIDDYTIKITLKEEVPFFEYMLCFPIIASHAYENETLISKTENLVGTGKYKISKIEQNMVQLDIANFNNNNKIQKINVFIKDNTNNLYAALSKKEVDFIVTDNVRYEEYIGTMGYNVSSSYGREFEYLVFNIEDNILSNKEVRKAISYVIDRNNINYNIHNNKYYISNYPLEYGSYLCEKKDMLEYNVNKAKSILVENGWTYKNNIWRKGSKRLEFNLAVSANNENRIECANKIKEDLNEIGIIINIVKINDNVYNSYIKNKKYDMMLLGNIVSNNPNLETYFGENNLSNYHNAEITSIMNEIKNINDGDLLREKYLRIEKIYKEELPFIGLTFNNVFVLSNTNLKGDLSHNWYNLFYNIENWYKVE